MKMLSCGALMTLMAMIGAPSSDAAVMMRGRNVTVPSRGFVQRPVEVRRGFVPPFHDGHHPIVVLPRVRSHVVFVTPFPFPFFSPFPVYLPPGAVDVVPYRRYPPQDSLTDASASYVLGYDWASDLRQNIATWDGFVTYVKASVLTADAKLRDEFARGFTDGYGVNGKQALDKAMVEARAPAAAGAPSAYSSG
jgi:hypothetical protein